MDDNTRKVCNEIILASTIVLSLSILTWGFIELIKIAGVHP